MYRIVEGKEFFERLFACLKCPYRQILLKSKFSEPKHMYFTLTGWSLAFKRPHELWKVDKIGSHLCAELVKGMGSTPEMTSLTVLHSSFETTLAMQSSL